MEKNKLFVIINRINSVLFLLFLIVGLGGSFLLFNELSKSSRRNAIEITPPDKGSKEVIELSSVQRVYGKDIQFIHVYSKKDGVLVSGGYTRTLRNLLFLSSPGGEPTWLLPNNDSKIIQSRQLTSRIDEKLHTDFFYVEVTSENQGVKLGVSNPGGFGLKYVDSGVSKVLEYEYLSEDKKLGVLLQVGNELRYRVYDLNALAIISDKFVIRIK